MENENQKNVFKLWLLSGDNSVFETNADDYRVMIFRVRKSADFDYLYCQRQYRRIGIERGGKFEYSGIYCKKDRLLYDSHELWGVAIAETADERNPNGLKETLKQAVREAVEFVIINREHLRITELTEERELRELEYFPKYSAPNKAREAYLSGKYVDSYDFTFMCNYKPDEWTEDSLLRYILDPASYAESEAAAYIDTHQESMLSAFLQADMIAEEYKKIIDNPANPVHCVKRIIQAMRNSTAKTVTVTIRKDGIEFTFKADAGQFRSDCISYYSDYHIVASDRREFERIFGRNSHYMPEEIVKIEYARSVLYEAEDKNL